MALSMKATSGMTSWRGEEDIYCITVMYTSETSTAITSMDKGSDTSLTGTQEKVSFAKALHLAT